jgi:Flp pilus assembly protein CpaB
MSNNTQTNGSGSRLIHSAIDPLFSIIGLLIGIGIGVFVGMSTNPEIAMPPTPLATPTFDAAQCETQCGYSYVYIAYAAQDIPVGKIIERTMLVTNYFPVDYVVETTVAGFDEDEVIAYIVGQVARVDIARGMIITTGLFEP